MNFLNSKTNTLSEPNQTQKMLKISTTEHQKLFESQKAKARASSRERTSSTGAAPGKKIVLKKDGHGRGAWGKVGSEVVLPKENEKDPNFEKRATPIEMVETKYAISKADMQEFLQTPLDEYFSNGIAKEAVRPMKEIADPVLNHEIVAFIIREACAKDNTERELASVLLLELCTSRVLDMSFVQSGFKLVFKEIDDLALDTPDADHVVAKFIARAVSDEIVAPKFVSSYNVDDLKDDNKVRRCIKKVKGLINTPHGLARLEHVWGVSGALSPIKNVQREINLILQEYLSCGSIDEATKCLRELKVNTFHHEFVYSMVLIAVESGDHKIIQTMVSLLQVLGSSGENLISDHQLKNGLDRILNDIHDIAIDVPHVKKHLASFYRLAAPCIPDALKLTNERLYPDVPEDELELPKERTDSRKRSISLTAELQPEHPRR